MLGAAEQLVLTVPYTVPPAQLMAGASLRTPPQLDGGDDMKETLLEEEPKDNGAGEMVLQLRQKLEEIRQEVGEELRNGIR